MKQENNSNSLLLCSVGNNADGFRIDQIAMNKNSFIGSGYGLLEKKAIICSWNNKLEMDWSLVSDTLEAFEEPASAIDEQGNYLVVNKNINTTPYYGYFTLIQKEGKVLWTQRTDHIDVMSDIVVLRNNQFLVSFKQKGAYIDGGTTKKYYMASSLWITADGALVQKYKYLVDRDKFTEFNIHKTLEDVNGNIYYFGSVLLPNNRTDLLIFKVNPQARVQWSYSYPTQKDLSIKSATISPEGKIFIAADSYGRTGGFLLAELESDGNIYWNNFITTSPYEQIKNLFWSNNELLLVYDKTLNVGIMHCSIKGECCSGESSKLNIKFTPADIQLSNSNAEFEPTGCRWTAVHLDSKIFGEVQSITDCK